MNKQFRSNGLLLLVLVFSLYIFTIRVAEADVLIWEAQVPSSGAEVQSPILMSGVKYRIVAKEIFWYNFDNNLTADAQYYTTDPDNEWIWTDHLPAPGGHSFLRVNGLDVDWGPFSNGEIIGDPDLDESYIGHTYVIYYFGQGAVLKFRIVDWVDNNYENNECYLLVQIYREYAVGGTIIDSNHIDYYSLMVSSVGIAAICGLALILVRIKND